MLTVYSHDIVHAAMKRVRWPVGSHEHHSHGTARFNAMRLPSRRRSLHITLHAYKIESDTDLQSETSRVSAAEKMAEYNKKMAERMGWIDNPYEYRPERGLYYHYIQEDVLCGSQPRSVDDIELLRLENVATLLTLQQEKDLEYWGVDFSELEEAASDSDIEYVRVEAVDFDGDSLRRVLPRAVATLEKARLQSGRVYVHCTAGLGRSPAVIIASLFWLYDIDLDEAYEYVTSIRPCGPNKDAIRGATFDLLDDRQWHEFQHLPDDAFKYLSSDDRRRIRENLGLPPAC